MSLVGTQVALCHNQMCNMQPQILGGGGKRIWSSRSSSATEDFGAIPGYNETLSKPKIIIKYGIIVAVRALVMLNHCFTVAS